VILAMPSSEASAKFLERAEKLGRYRCWSQVWAGLVVNGASSKCQDSFRRIFETEALHLVA